MTGKTRAIDVSSYKRRLLRQTLLLLFCLLLFVGCGLRPTPQKAATPPAESTPPIVAETPPPVLEEVEEQLPPVNSGKVLVGSVASRGSGGHGSGKVTTGAVASRELKKVIEQPQVTSNATEVKVLAQELSRGLSSDREKAHAFYRWLGENIAYNVEGLYSGNLGDNSPEAVLRDRIAVCAGYARLFDALCKEAGLESEYVVGCTRTDGDELPPSLRDSDTNHAWNAVKLDGRWQLLDPTWGAGSVGDDRKFVREPDDEWWLVDPEVFIYSHLPEEEKWQLLSAPISRSKFESLPDLRPQFFNLGLELIEPEWGTFECDGEVLLKVRSSDNTTVYGAGMQNGQWLSEGTRFSRRVGNETQMIVRFPAAGEYELHILASKPDEQMSESVGSFSVIAKKAVTATFPKTYLTYKEHDCELVQPLQGKLSAGRPTRVEVKIPGARAAWVRNGEQALPMKRRGDVYTLDFTPRPGEVAVAGAFEGDKGKMWSLLQYSAE